jgi:hypothetical protein
MSLNKKNGKLPGEISIAMSGLHCFPWIIQPRADRLLFPRNHLVTNYLPHVGYLCTGIVTENVDESETNKQG